MTTPTPPAGAARPVPPQETPQDRAVRLARRAARQAQLLALGAVAVAVLSVILSLAALANRRDAGAAQSSTPAATSTTDSVTEPPTEPTGADERPTGTGVVDTRRVTPDADFKVVYEKQALRVQPPEECNEARYVDLDEPRVETTQQIAEFGYSKECGGGIKARIDVTDFLPISSVASESAVAKDCAEAIRNGPINEPLVPTDRTRLCLITAAETAESQGISQKVVLLVVTGIAQDGTMTILVTAWSVPR